MREQEKSVRHFSELEPLGVDHEWYREHETYRRVVGQLLEQGHKGKWVTIKGDTVIAVGTTLNDVFDDRPGRDLPKPWYLHLIREYEFPFYVQMPMFHRTEPNSPRSIHHSELAPAEPDSPLFTEHEFYRREVARLLAEGHEGKTVLIKGEQIIGIFEKEKEAYEAGLNMFHRQPFMIRQIWTREPVVLVIPRGM